MSIIELIVLAIVEGITEFLPISSTGHLIIVSSLFGIQGSDFVKVFMVNIQFGAILSVVILYWKRFFQSLDFYLKLLVAFIPAAIIGFFLGDFIDGLLENVIVVAVMLIIGGIILLFIDQIFKNNQEEKETTYKSSFVVGLFQCIALIPGVSRSASTIIGGLTQGWTRKHAAEFSFFLAVPTMFAASAYKLLKSYKTIEPQQIQYLLLGNIIAFLVAMLAIKFFITFLTKHGFKVFGYYRIGLGIVILVLLFSGFSLQI